MKKLTKKGFTLIEVIVVVAIIAIMAAVAIPTYSGYVANTRTRMDALEARNDLLEDELEDIQAEINLALPVPTVPTT